MAGDKDKDKDKDKDGDALDLSKNPVIVEMSKALKGLGVLLTAQQQQSAKTNEGLTALVESLKSGEFGKKPKEDDKDVDPDAINDLDNAQLVPLVLGEVAKLLDKKIGQVDDRIDNTDKTIADQAVADQVKALLPKHPDLFDWVDEIKALSEKNPDTKLSVKQLYTLVKEDNPTKVAEMTEKYKDKEGEDKEDEAGLIGLMPTSGAMLAEDDEKLTKEEAAEQAWDDTLENFPALAQLGEG